MMVQDLLAPGAAQTQLRLTTLIRLRWMAIVGQSAAVIVVAYVLHFPVPVSLCFGLIACSAWLNLFLAFRYPATQRLGPGAEVPAAPVESTVRRGTFTVKSVKYCSGRT